MDKSTTQDILEDFIFLDCRLGDHPKLISRVFWRQIDNPSQLLASTKKSDVMPSWNVRFGYRIGQPLIIENKMEYFILTDHASGRESGILQEGPLIQSQISVPIISGMDVLGFLSITSKERNAFEQKHLGHAQLLAAIIGYSITHIDGRIRIPTPLSTSLGGALQRVREELGHTQAQIAERIATSRIALSRWETGAQLPTRGPFYRWCQALGLFANRQPTIVKVVDISPHLIKLLREHPEKLYEISPHQFEQLVAERLDRMGFDVRLTGMTSSRDGGIDLIAVPKSKGLGTFVLAGQVKHHKSGKKTGREAVDRLLSWRNSPFSIGLLVTNTAFTRDAIWLAEREGNKPFLRLRDFEDLKLWLQEKLWSPQEWREIPDEITLAPGITVKIPKSILSDSLTIWPLDKGDPNLMR